MKERANIAVIMAAGTGVRAGFESPKQYMDLKGRMVLERAVDAFEKHGEIDCVAIVVHPREIPRVEKIVIRNDWKKVTHILEGGEDRFHSSLAAVRAFCHMSEDNLILHDAARPLVTERIISRVIESLRQYRAVGVGVPVSDTLFFTGPEHDQVIRVPDRNLFLRAQTPQGFRISILLKAYEKALADPSFSATDDCGVVRRYLHREKIRVVEGDDINIKITYPGDLEWLCRRVEN